MRNPIAEPLPFDPNQVTPGVLGFTATALIAVVVIVLLIDFFRRVSRINDRADAKERIEAELAAQRQADADAGGDAAAADPTDDAPRPLT